MKLRFIFSFVTFSLLAGKSFSQVNPQNGAAQVNIPLYSYSDPGNRLGLNASLIYVDGNGLKVSEMASAVGTGWVLDCGGSITRIQHGEPDDQKNNNTYDYDNNFTNYTYNYFPDGYLYTTYTPSDLIDNGGAYTPYDKYVPHGIGVNGPSYVSYAREPQYLADRDQDIFAFSFNGRVGQFVIGKNKQAKTLNDSKLKIDLQETDMSSSGIRTRISQFTITDESGIKYVFKDLKLDYVCTYNNVRIAGSAGNVNEHTDLSTRGQFYTPPTYGSNPSGGDNLINVIMGTATSQFIVDKWYLSQIINPLTNKQITLNYSIYEEDIDADKQIGYSVTNNHGTVAVYWEKYKTRDSRLSSVILTNNERLDLTYSSSPRIDLVHQNTLNQLKVSYNNNPVYSWNFGYGYMVGIDQAIKGPGDSNTDQEKQWARLCLTTLQKTGLNSFSEPPYRFNYNMGGDNGVAVADVIPPMFSIYQDHFGYYNGGVITSPVPEGSATAFYSVAGLKILLGASVGGSDGFYKKPLQTIAKNGILKTITYPLGGSLTFAYETNTTSQIQLGGVRVQATMQYDGVNHSNDIIKQYKYINTDGSPSGWGGETYQYIRSVPLIAPNCGGNESPAFSVKNLAKTYIQDGFMTGAFGFASGEAFAAAMAGSVEEMAISMIIAIVVELTNSDNSNENYGTQIYSNTSTISNNPLPWGYARTEVVSQLSTDNIGKAVYEFSTPQDHPIEVPTLAVLFSNKPRFSSWVYGLPKTITIFDKAGHTVRQTVNHYNFNNAVNSIADDNYKSKSWSPAVSQFGCSLKPSTLVTNLSTNIQQESYYPLTGHIELTGTDEYTFNALQQSTVVTTNYEYDANFQLKHKYFNNSKGEELETFYYHPYDYSTAPGAIGTMNTTNSNISSPVLSTETYINKSDGKYLIGAVNTDFDVYSNGDIKPKITYSFQSALPIVNTSLAPFSSAQVLRDPSYFKQMALYDYDNHGNLIQTVTGGNKVVSNIYDYDGKLVVASVTNASYGDIGYTSFEAEGGKPGSWVNTAAIVTDDARTGNKSFNLSDPSNPANNYFGFGGLNSGLTYIVSYWSKNGTACINGSKAGQTTINTCQGTSGWKQGTTVNQWTYYEKQVSNADKISLSGTGLVDEFRIYPVGAQMTTTTYSPLIGKTSECDVSNRVTYYWYDDLGRLVKVSDDQRNTIRTYEYNYKQ